MELLSFRPPTKLLNHLMLSKINREISRGVSGNIPIKRYFESSLEAEEVEVRLVRPYCLSLVSRTTPVCTEELNVDDIEVLVYSGGKGPFQLGLVL